MEKNNRLDPPKRKRQLLIAIVIAIVVVLLFVLVIGYVVVFITQKPVDLSQVSQDSDRPHPQRSFRKFANVTDTYRKFTFDDLFSGKIFLKDSYALAWSKNNELLRRKDEFFFLDHSISKTDPETFEESDFLDESQLLNSLSATNEYGYTSRVVKQGFRHSNEEHLSIWKIANGTNLPGSVPVGPKGTGNEIIQHFEWSPNSKSNCFVFVHNYNLYYQEDPQKAGSAVQITENGSDLLRYGLADWLYEEEILSSKDAVWWSESGRYLAYMSFDDRAVSRIFVAKYSQDMSYPQYQEIPYPKAGVEENPIVRLHIWDRDKNNIVVATAPEGLKATNQSYYIFSNTWIKLSGAAKKELGPERLLTVWANREQNQIYLTLCNEVDCALCYQQSFIMQGRSLWAEPGDFWTILGSRKGFFITLPHAYADGNVYNHVAHVEIKPSGAGVISVWHGGPYDVDKLKGYNSDQDMLTFTSTGGGIGTYRLYRINGATNEEGTILPISSYISDCEYGSYQVSPNGLTASLSCSNIFKNTKLWIMDIKNPNKNLLLDGGDEIPLPFDVPDISFEVARLPSGYDAHIAVMKPPKFDPTRKYPILLDVYGGPGSSRVKRTTASPNLIHYCSNYGIIIVWVDGRGTSGRGWNMKAPVYKILGHFEAVDTLDSIKYLTSKYSYMDPQRVAIFGWSYGGFLSTHVAIADQGRSVKCAIAVAPVTDMALYDSAYTERYMGLPLENTHGYNASNILTKAGNLKNVRYMLAHGEADDNVHYQHSALLSEVLQAQMIHFTQLVYSNQDHSLSSRQRHLFSEVGRFLANCFEL